MANDLSVFFNGAKVITIFFVHIFDLMIADIMFDNIKKIYTINHINEIFVNWLLTLVDYIYD